MKTERRRRSAFFFALTLSSSLLFAAPAHKGSETDLPLATDLRSAGTQAARSGGPLVIIFSRHGCKYCEIVKRDYLKPLASHPKYREQLLILQVNQDSDAAMTGFHGEQTSHASFAASEKIKLVPVVAFYGPSGQRLADPIVGLRLPDFYQSYLETAIEQSIVALKRR